MLEIISAEYAGGCRLRVCFSNGDAGTVDLTDSLWGPVFEPLRDPAAFKRFEVSPVLHTVRWKNDADLAPEFLYEKMVEQRDGPDRRSRAFPDKPVTHKPSETRMGKGKGAPDGWVCVIKPGRILYEVDGVDAATAAEALRLARHKFGFPTRIVARRK